RRRPCASRRGWNPSSSCPPRNTRPCRSLSIVWRSERGSGNGSGCRVSGRIDSRPIFIGHFRATFSSQIFPLSQVYFAQSPLPSRKGGLIGSCLDVPPQRSDPRTHSSVVEGVEEGSSRSPHFSLISCCRLP